MDADTWDPEIGSDPEAGSPPENLPAQVAEPVDVPSIVEVTVGKPYRVPRWAWASLGLATIMVAALSATVILGPGTSELTGKVVNRDDWDSLERFEMGTTKVFESDSGNWELTVNSVDWNVTDLPADLDPAPPRTNYIGVNITARDTSYSDSSAWVSFHFDYLTDDSHLYPEAMCYEGCLPTARMDYVGKYTGTLYFLVPAGTIDGYLYVDSRVNTDPDVLMMLADNG